MANEKIYVGKDGAKELYRHIKGLIPEVDRKLDENSNNAISNRTVTLALRNFGGFEPAEPTGEDNHPDVDNPSTKIIYLVELPDSPDPDHYMEWIWSEQEGEQGKWKCIGDVSKLTVDSWKQWSIDHGSTGVDNTIYIGSNTTLNIASTVALGHGNSATYVNVGEPYESSSNILLGSQNESFDSKYAFQLGTNNTVDGETNPSALYPVALNIGNHNEIRHYNNDVDGETVPVKNAEGVNIGKSNYAIGFGINLGQSNHAYDAGVSIGENNSSYGSGISIGNNSSSSGCGVALGQYASAYGSSFAVGYHATANQNSVAIGEGTYANAGGYAIGQRAIAGEASFCVGFGGSYSSSSTTRQATANNAAICLAVGYNNGAYACHNSIILSTHHIEDVSSNSNNYASVGSIIVGSRNYATNRAVVIGDNNYGTNYARIIGNDNNVPNSSLVFGSNNDSYGGYGVLIGRSNTINGGTTTAYNAAIGLQNTVEAEAFAIGRENVLGGWAFALGVSNVSSSGRNGHATLLGYNNSSIVTYPREYIAKKVNGETVQEKCHSFLVGYKNDGKHWNSILIGAENTSKPATVDTPLSSEEHDDGFTTAIGYRNLVGRNYDFAYGYMSTADGGENVAFQHSTAIGYRNLGMFDSSIKGTGNIALVESMLNVTNGTSNSDTKMFTHNTLINSLWTSATPYTYSYGIHHNVLMSVNASIYGNYGVQGNFIFGGRNGTDYNGSPYNPISINTDNAVTSNFIFGNTASGISIGAKYGLLKNIIVCPELMSIGSDDNITKNVILNSSINMSKAYTVLSNIMHTANVSGTFGTVMNNIVLGDSVINSSCDSVPSGIYKNVLIGNARLDHTTAESAWDGSLQPTGNNVLFGSYGIDVYGCFSLSDAQPSLYATPLLNNCLRIFNFGDNNITRASETQVFGGKNTARNIKHSFVVGDSNTLTSSATSSLGEAYGVIGFTTIFGSKNLVNTDSESSVDRAFISGNNNSVVNCCYDLRILGNDNDIGTGSKSPTIVEVSTLADYVEKLNGSTPLVIHTSTAMPKPGVVSTITGGQTVSTDYYMVYEGILYSTWRSPGTYTRITGSEFVSKFFNHTLTEGAWYYITSNATVPTGQTIPKGEVTETSTSYSYLVGNGKISGLSSTYYNSRNFVVGDKNELYPGINDSTIIGTNNKITRKFGNYSNTFIQGNDNTADEGSGVIVFGSGNHSIGHAAVAVGTQLLANQWQTVIGKYNTPIAGPERTAKPFSPYSTYKVNEYVYYDHNYYRCTVAVESAGAWTGAANWTVDYPDQESALFIIGNGYSENDGADWQSESYIHRSNAMEVYADGTVKARKFISDEPTLALSSGTGIDISETSTNVVISLDSETAGIISTIKSRPSTGRWVLESNNGVLSWVAVGLT